MTKQRVYNFAAGPAMLPEAVMDEIQGEFKNFKGEGVGLIEMSHRGAIFMELLNETDELIREITGLPESHEILYMHGGGTMQYSAVPLNLINRKPSHKAIYLNTGEFAGRAIEEAKKFGAVEVLYSGESNKFSELPKLSKDDFNQDASYAYLVSNNTLFGTQFPTYPFAGEVPLVVDATSDILSRQVDYSKIAVLFAGVQKNLGAAGLALVFVRKDLMEYAPDNIPKLLSYKDASLNHSVANTANTFSIYTVNKVLKWLKAEGGISAIEKMNRKKAELLYQVLDQSKFYKSVAHKDFRSNMNVCFHLPTEELLTIFLAESKAAGFIALKGHSKVGGARASIYNAMPIEGVQALASFLQAFETRYS